MKVLYVRVSDTAHAYIAAMAAHTGLSMATITSLVIDEARRRGWHIETNGARVTDTVESPAASSPALTPRDQGQVPRPTPPRGTGEPGPSGDAA